MSVSTLLALSLATIAYAAPTSSTPPKEICHGITGDAKLVRDRSFDYIIAGGGLTGLTVASLLTEDPNISVLVIEGGHDNHADPRVNDVRTYGEAFGSELDYNLTSTPIKWQNGSSLALVAGKTLGGSGSINGASWTKGDKTQYDILPLLNGDQGWNWEGFNAEALKSENFHPPSDSLVAKGAEFQAAYHGEGGEVQVSFANGMFTGIDPAALEASGKVWKGLTTGHDLAAGVTNGATVIPNMLNPDVNQNRSSPFTAYAQHQVEYRNNFLILTGHRVVEIVWKEGTDALVAEGVRFQACREADIETVQASREVLLAAGSLQSPQILELSGVGNPDVLAAAGIPLKKAAPGVGKNMQEQTKNSLYFKPKSTDFDGSGPSNAIAFPNVDQIFGDNSTATYNWVMSSLPGYAAELEKNGHVVNGTAAHMILAAQVDNLWKDQVAAAEIFYTINTATGLVGIDLWNLIVMSRGTVHVRSNSSWDQPAIDSHYFGHGLDLMIQTKASMQARQVYQTEPLASQVIAEELPSASVPQGAAEDVWEEWVKQTFTSVWHYIATLSMMKEEFGGVVDHNLKVYGIENVRAIDASVLPIQLSAHLSSSLYGIAQKAAAAIKADQ